MLEAVDQRIVRGLPATLRLTPSDQEGAPLVVAGPIDVTVTDHAGVEVLTGAASESAGVWSVDVAASVVAVLDLWTVAWVDTSTGAVWTTTVEVTGGHTVTVARIVASDPTIASTSDAEAIAARLVAEVEAEWICDRVFTPRLRSFTVDGDGSCDLMLPFHDIRTLRHLSVGGRQVDVDSVTIDDGMLVRSAGWAAGRANVTGAIEIGMSAAPPDLAAALLTRIRTIILGPDSHVPLTAIEWQPEAGGSYRLDRASRFRCGIPEVDAVLFRYSRRASVGDDEKPAPASRPIDINPSASSLFHGGRR